MSDLDVSDFGAFVSSSKGLDVSDFDSFISKSKPSESGDTWRGAKTAAKQLPQLGYGLIAGAGAVAESAFGEGGVSSAVKEFGVRKYQESGADIAKDAKETDSLTYSWDQAKQGNYGAMVDWLQYGIGYGGVQALEALASGGLGAVLGKATLKQAVEHLASGMVSKEVAKIVETEAGKKLAASAVQKMAVANVAANIGSTVGIGAQAFGMEGGEIMGGLAEQSSKEGRALTGAEIAKGLGATLAAGSLEFVGDKLGVDLMLGKSALVKPVAGMAGIGGRAARAGVGAIGAIPAEAGTEYFQTGIEEYGQGKEANILPWNQSPEAQRQAFDAAGLGGLGGGAMAVGGGLLSSPVQPTAKPADTPRPTTPADILAAAQTPDEAIAAFQGAVEPAIAATQAEIDAMLEDPLEDWASLNPIQPPRQFGALSQDPTGFGLQSELADLIAQEAQDVEQKRQALAEQQGIKRESDLETVYARVEGTRQAESRQNRLKLLDDIYANPDERTPAMTFLSRLRAEFPMNPEPTPEEKLFMSKRETAYQAFKSMPPDETDSGPVASPPNEGGDFGIKERKPNQPAPAGDRVRVAQALLTRKGNRIARDGSAIRNKDGKVLFTFRAGELDQVQSQPQGPSNASQAAETPLPVVPQEARQDEALPEQIAPTPEEVSAVQPALPEQVAQLPAVREQLSVEFGGQRYPVESLQDASAKWEKFRDETGAGVSDIGNGVPIFDQTGKQVAYVSYNGKVWQGAEYDAKAEPVYVPKEQSNPEASRPNPAPTPITAEPLSQTVVAPTQEKAAPAPKGAAVLAQRQQIAAQKFIESAGEQFGLSREEAGRAWDHMVKSKLINVDAIGGQYTMKDGRLWDGDALRRAAAAEQQAIDKAKAPAITRTKGGKLEITGFTREDVAESLKGAKIKATVAVGKDGRVLVSVVGRDGKLMPMSIKQSNAIKTALMGKPALPKKKRGLTGNLRNDLSILAPGLYADVARGRDGAELPLDVGEIAERLRDEFDYTLPEVDTGKESDALIELIQRDILNGGGTLNNARMAQAMTEEETRRHRSDVYRLADEYGIETKRGIIPRRLEEIEAELKVAIEQEVEIAGKGLASVREYAIKEGVPADEVDAIMDQVADLYDKDTSPDKFVLMYREATNQIQERIDGYQEQQGRDGQGQGAVEHLPQGEGSEERPALELASQSEAEARAEIAQQEAAAAQRQAEDDRAAAAERRARIDAEVAGRQGIAADNFTLDAQVNDKAKQKKVDAKRIDEQLAGQGDLLSSPAPARGEAGASLTKEQRKAVMQTLVDVYKTKGAPKESKGLDQNGNERSGYAYSPELFEKSDITGAPIRYVVTLPDGRIAHPTELFPDMTLSKVEALILEQKGKERDKAELDKFRREQLERRKSDTINEANAKFNRANPGLGLEFVPALLTDGKQFIRAHPDTVANDLRLLGRDWVEKPLGVNAQAQEAPQQTPADAGVSVSAGANVLDFAKGKKVTHKAIVAETGQVIELKNQDAVEAITDIQRDIDALEALKLCIGA